jgi:hypothetical protein
MAKLLYLMRCHDEAFEIFRYIICQPIIDISSTGDVGHWLLSSAIGCVRSARSSQNMQISQELILGLFGDSENSNAGHTACHVQDNFYKKTLLAGLQGLAEELLEDTACWPITTNRSRSAQPSSPSPSSTALSLLKECSYLRRAIVDSLEKMIVYLEENEEDLDREWASGSIRDRGHTIAQLIACRLLESSFRDKCAEPGPVDTDLCCQLNHPRCATIVKGQALATLPFIVAYWEPRYELPGLRITFGPARHFLMATKSALGLILSHSHADNSGYEIFMEMYLGLLDQRDEEVRMSGNISHHRFLAVAAATAGVFTIPGLHRLGFPCRHLEPDAVPESPRQALEEIAMSPHVTEHARDRWKATQSSSFFPTLARSVISHASSMSSDFRSFQAMSSRVRGKPSMSVHSTKQSDRMSWRFGSVTGLSSGPSVGDGAASDIMMDSMAEDRYVYGWGPWR